MIGSHWQMFLLHTLVLQVFSDIHGANKSMVQTTYNTVNIG